jgi:hypothetical protein
VEITRPSIYKAEGQVKLALRTGADMLAILQTRLVGLENWLQLEEGRKKSVREIDVDALREAIRMTQVQIDRMERGPDDPFAKGTAGEQSRLKIERAVDKVIANGAAKAANRDKLIAGRIEAARRRAVEDFVLEERNWYAHIAGLIMRYHTSYANAPEKLVGVKAKETHAAAASALASAE